MAFDMLGLFKWVEQMLRDKGEVKADSITFVIDPSPMSDHVVASFTGVDGLAKQRKVSRAELEAYALEKKHEEEQQASVVADAPVGG